MRPKDLSKHVGATYRALRLGVAFVTFSFPLILWLGGRLRAGLPLQGSMSAYYHASTADDASSGVPGQGVMRNAFVGILFAVGAILFLYQGISKLEDYALNGAGVMALGVALFPTAWPVDPEAKGHFLSLHGTCAISFFLCIGIVCIFCASDTLGMIPDAAVRQRYRRGYLMLGVSMVALPLAAAMLKYFAPLHDWTIFFVEVAGIYVFAAYWLVKSHEISRTGLDQRAARGRLRVEQRPLSEVLRLRPMTITPADGQP